MRLMFPSKDLRGRMLRDVVSVLHLPFFARLFHRKARRAIVGFSLGVMIMLTGSAIAASVKHMDTLPHFVHIVVDTCGYLLHGIGAIPICKHWEPVWALVFGATQEVSA